MPTVCSPSRHCSQNHSAMASTSSLLRPRHDWWKAPWQGPSHSTSRSWSLRSSSSQIPHTQSLKSFPSVSTAVPAPPPSSSSCPSTSSTAAFRFCFLPAGGFGGGAGAADLTARPERVVPTTCRGGSTMAYPLLLLLPVVPAPALSSCSPPRGRFLLAATAGFRPLSGAVWEPTGKKRSVSSPALP